MVVVAVVLALAGVVALLLAAGEVVGARRDGRAAAYLEDVLEVGARDLAVDDGTDRLALPFGERVARPAVARVARGISSVTPRGHRIAIGRRLVEAGLDTRIRPEEIIAAEVAGLVAGLLAGVGLLATGRLGPVTGLLVVVVLVGAGAFAPAVWLHRATDRRTTGIRRELPETLDLLAISVEAGLGLEGAIEVVVDEGTGPLALELDRTLQEMELGVSRRDALAHLRERTHVPELSTFVQALVQADILGMPLTRVLKLQADEMRTKRRQWARERAGKLPVKILFPLIGCIFPAVLLVILGPAMATIGNAL